MKVVRIITRLNLGGPLRQLQALVPGLARLGIEGPLWVGEPAEGETDQSHLLTAAGVEVVKVPGLRRPISPLADRTAYRWMRERLRAEKPDVVHTHTGKAGALGRRAAWAADVPVIVHTFHGHHLRLPYLAGSTARLVERRLARFTTAAICLSELQYLDLVDPGGVIPEEKAVVIGPGIDIEALRASVDPEAVAHIRAQTSTRDLPIFLWLGRFVSVKRPLAMVAAASAANASSPDSFRLLLAGDGRLRSETERAIHALGLDSVARCVGPISDPASWIAASAAVVISSWSEGTPIVAIEAASLGVPVIATAVGGVPDVVRDGETGILVPSEDKGALEAAMGRIASDPGLRERLGRNARAESDARFGVARLVAETAALYQRLRHNAP